MTAQQLPATPAHTALVAGAACTRLPQYGVVSVAGDEARAFLHAQLTIDFAHLPAGRGGIAGWCSAKGRLLASFFVVPAAGGFLLVLARDLAAPVAKRLAMFVLRSQVRVADMSAQWSVLGVWGEAARERLAAAGLAHSGEPFAVAAGTDGIALCVETDRYLVLTPPQTLDALALRLDGTSAQEDDWRVREVRAGRALISQATQDLFVPQMVNLELIGGVDFKKGCYPGQEVVARAQYRGQLKRRMVRARLPEGTPARDGQDLYGGEGPEDAASGTVVNVAPAPGGAEVLAVVPIAALERGLPIRVQPGGAPVQILALPYPT